MAKKKISLTNYPQDRNFDNELVPSKDWEGKSNSFLLWQRYVRSWIASLRYFGVQGFKPISIKLTGECATTDEQK